MIDKLCHTIQCRTVENFRCMFQLYRNIIDKYLSNEIIFNKDMSNKPELY